MVHTRDLRHEPWRYRLRAFVSKPANLLLVFFLIVLVVLSLLPMATMLSNMFTVHVGTEKKLLRLPVDSTTLWHFQKLFAGDEWSQVNFWQPLWNSLIVALGSGILGIAVGGTVAWFITRSDLKCKKFISGQNCSITAIVGPRTNAPALHPINNFLSAIFSNTFCALFILSE